MTIYIRVILTALITLASLASIGMAASAQTSSTESFMSELTGAVVEIPSDGDASFDHFSHAVYTTSGGYTQEDIRIVVGETHVVGIHFAEGDVTPQKWQDDSFVGLTDAYYNYLDVLGNDVSSEQGWFLAVGNDSPGQSEAIYSEHHQNDVDGILTDIDTFSYPSTAVDSIAWVQNNITIDGEPVYQDTNLEDIESMLGGNGEQEAQRLYRFDSEVSDWKDQGLVSETEWTEFRTQRPVTWNAPELHFPLYRAIAIREEEGDHYLELTVPETGDRLSVVVYEYPEDTDGHTLAETWSSESWLQNSGLDLSAIDSTSTDTSASVAMKFTGSYGQQVKLMREAYLVDDGLWLLVTIEASAETLGITYSTVMDNLMYDGQKLPSSWTASQITEMYPQSSSAAETESSNQNADRQPNSEAPSRSSRSAQLPGTEATAASTDWAEMGLVSDTEWHSPISDTTFSWDTNLWVFPQDQPDAIILESDFTSLTLNTLDGKGEAILVTDMLGMPIDGWHEMMLSDDWAAMQEADGQPFTIIDSYADETTASVILVHHAEDGDLIVILDVYQNEDGVTILTEITAAPEDIAAVYVSVWDGVQSNGDYYPLTWTIEDIEAVDID